MWHWSMLDYKYFNIKCITINGIKGAKKLAESDLRKNTTQKQTKQLYYPNIKFYELIFTLQKFTVTNCGIQIRLH